MSDQRRSYHAHRITVPRSARYYTLGDPHGADEVWIVLHGYSQLAATFLRWFEPAAAPKRAIVAPEALSRSYYDETTARRVGASWMTKEDREAEISDYIRYLDLLADEVLGNIPPRARLELHGFSQGAATASRWAALGRHPVDRLVLWGGLVPPDLDLERLRTGLRGGSMMLVSGTTDRYVSPEALRNEQSRLTGIGLAATTRSFTGGHSVDRSTLVAIA
ncbi:MAG: alpha/beta hydrolase [Gemmatimonadales bacterium]